MSYRRVGHPSELINIGDTVKVQIVRINKDTQRISLGMKQLEADPCAGATAKYPVGGKFTGRVTHITDSGAFVDREAGIDSQGPVPRTPSRPQNVHPRPLPSPRPERDHV